jgi:hypothetical protein
MYKRLFLLIAVLLTSVLPSHAVLKEKDLEQTLTILRQDITNFYQNLQHEAEGHKEEREHIIRNLINISKRSSQNALMLYSQKEEYVFDLTYACNEVTKLYREYHRSIQPFRNSITNIDTEIARYDSLKNSLDKMSYRSLSDKARIDRNVCLTLAVCISRMLRENKESMSDYIKIYESTEERLQNLHDYANLRYNEIQNNIFVNGGENYLSILSNFRGHLSKTKDMVLDKYEPYDNDIKSQWDSRMIIGLFITMGIFALAAMLISILGAKALPDKLRTESFLAKRTVIIMTATTTDISKSNELRWGLWMHTIDIIGQNPFFGEGFVFHDVREGIVFSLHNLAMARMTESTILLFAMCFGVPVMCLFLHAIYATLRHFYRYRQYEQELGFFLGLTLDLFWGGSIDNCMSVSILLLSMYLINYNGYIMSHAERYAKIPDKQV